MPEYIAQAGKQARGRPSVCFSGRTDAAIPFVPEPPCPEPPSRFGRLLLFARLNFGAILFCTITLGATLFLAALAMSRLHVLAQLPFRIVPSVALTAGDPSRSWLCHVRLPSESSLLASY